MPACDRGSLATRTYRVAWTTPAGELEAREPTAEELDASVAALAAGYNEPTNAVLLGHTAALDEADVRAHYESLRGEHGRAFLLYRDGVLVGDADLRGLAGQTGEFAFLIVDPASQGQGLGTRFAQMIHALAFGPLGMARLYAAVLPDNTASRRVFEKLGYGVDNTVEGHDYGDPGDIVLVIEGPTFLRLNAPDVAHMRIIARSEQSPDVT